MTLVLYISAFRQTIKYQKLSYQIQGSAYMRATQVILINLPSECMRSGLIPLLISCNITNIYHKMKFKLDATIFLSQSRCDRLAMAAFDLCSSHQIIVVRNVIYFHVDCLFAIGLESLVMAYLYQLPILHWWPVTRNIKKRVFNSKQKRNRDP